MKDKSASSFTKRIKGLNIIIKRVKAERRVCKSWMSFSKEVNNIEDYEWYRKHCNLLYYTFQALKHELSIQYFKLKQREVIEELNSL